MIHYCFMASHCAEETSSRPWAPANETICPPHSTWLITQWLQKLKNLHFSQFTHSCFCWKPLVQWALWLHPARFWSTLSFADPKSVVHIKGLTHLVVGKVRGQVDTRGLNFSSGGTSRGTAEWLRSQTYHTKDKVCQGNKIVISCSSVGKLTRS